MWVLRWRGGGIEAAVQVGWALLSVEMCQTVETAAHTGCVINDGGKLVGTIIEDGDNWSCVYAGAR